MSLELIIETQQTASNGRDTWSSRTRQRLIHSLCNFKLYKCLACPPKVASGGYSSKSNCRAVGTGQILLSYRHHFRSVCQQGRDILNWVMGRYVNEGQCSRPSQASPGILPQLQFPLNQILQIHIIGTVFHSSNRDSCRVQGCVLLRCSFGSPGKTSSLQIT